MPNRKEHVELCEELYGYGFEIIHKWMDGTTNFRGPNHRVDRHDPDETPKLAYEIFKDKVPDRKEKFIKDAVLEHIRQDVAESEGGGEEKDESPQNCPLCGDKPPSNTFHKVAVVSSCERKVVRICFNCLLKIARNSAYFEVLEERRCSVCTNHYSPPRTGAKNLHLYFGQTRHGICMRCWVELWRLDGSFSRYLDEVSSYLTSLEGYRGVASDD